MPDELREKLAEATARSGRSLNAEIVERLAESVDPEAPVRQARTLRAARGEGEMRRTWIAASAIALVVLVPIAAAALLAGDRPSSVAPAPTLAPGAQRLAEIKQLGVFANNVAEGEEFPSAGDAERYADRAYPQNAIAFGQTLRAIAADKRIKSRGARYPSKWVSAGPDTLQVAQLGTQHWGRPTQWSGRVSAMAVDTRHCSATACKLYIGAAGGGVWRTNNALAQRPNWKELSTGMDSQAIGSILIDPTDATGNTIYVGTGEPNGSSDSEAGVGLYRSTDGGNHWTLVPGSRAAAADRGIGGIVVDPSDRKHILIGTAVARHGLSATAGGRYTPPGAPRIGLWESRDGGATFQLVFSRAQDAVDPNSPNGSDFFRGGITDLEVDPQAPGTFYFTMFNEGVFRASFGTPAAPAQIFTEPNPDGPGGLGIRYQIATAALPDGRTRIYLGQGSNRIGAFPYTDASKVRRTDDARAAAVQWTTLSSNVRGTQAYSTWDFCRDQCSYDMPIASPPGRPDEVWVGGVTQYQELPTRGGVDRNMSNGRALMRSLDAGQTWTDMSGDAFPWPNWNAIHPDLHEIHFAPGGIAVVGHDGGVTRTSGTYVDYSAECDNPFRDLANRPLQLQMCRMWLTSIPTEVIDLNAGLQTLQFQGLAVDVGDPRNDVLGGTQDNGSPGMTNGSWELNVRGDGGPPAIDVNGVTRYHAYTGTFFDVNFEGNVQGSWIWISDPMAFSTEASAFYAPLEADPVVSESAFAGMQHVWRTKTAGNADKQFLRDHCNTDFGDRAVTGPSSGCGDWVPLGGAAGDLSAGPDLDKGGGAAGYVVQIERAPSDRSTMWVGTRRGRLFISRNADAEPASAVTYTRLDTAAEPRRYPSGIAVDPNDPNRAFVSFSGYDAYTPATPGHVFEVRANPATGTATWTNLSHDLGDQPITDIAYDARTGDLYASTDFGVSRLVAGMSSWVTAADGLPPVAVYQLQLVDNGRDRLLYAATHGRGAWRIDLPRKG
jgi:hypothetical protein